MLSRSPFRVGALLLIAALFPTVAASQDAVDIPESLKQKISIASEACAEFDNGEFALEEQAIKRIDLDGDDEPDWVLDEAMLYCSTAASMYCGTGGCMSHFVIGDSIHSLLNQGWQMVTFGPNRALLSDVHGSQCGGINPTPCVTASAWDQEALQWRSAIAEWE